MERSLAAGRGWAGALLIEWGAGTPHTQRGMRPRAAGWSDRAEHPDPHAIQAMLAAAGVELAVGNGQIPALVAEIETPRGTVIVK